MIRRPMHDRPMHDRPMHDRPMYDRPMHDRPMHHHRPLRMRRPLVRPSERCFRTDAAETDACHDHKGRFQV
jgi:hypothetical protein